MTTYKFKQHQHMHWNIQRKGRAWKGTEAQKKYSLTPEKIEMYKGKLFFSEKERMNMLCLLLENVGLDKAIEMCDTRLAEEAVREVKAKREN